MITISLCMIVKNEAAILERCLSAIAPAVDEIIIADTGSSDRTKAIARKFTSHIFDFPWNDNFSDARNFSFSKASMQYCMWLDADDVITPDNLKKLQDLKRTLPPRTDIVMLQYATGFDSGQSPSFFYYRERLIRRQGGFLWQGAVHECIAPSGNIIYSNIVIEHRPPAGHSHTQRNLKIYEKALRHGSVLSARDTLYYARELAAAGRTEDACSQFIKVIEDAGAWAENRIEACKNLSDALISLGRTEDAMDALFKSFSFDLPRAETLCSLGDLFKIQKRYPQAIYWYTLALHCQEHPENGGFTDREKYGYYPCVQLCVCYFFAGDPQTAFQYHKMSGRWHTDTPEYAFNEAFFQSYRSAHHD